MDNFEKAIYMLKHAGFLTGSRACGWFKDDSDYDYCFSIEHLNLIRQRMSKLVDEEDITPSYYNNGIKYKFGDKIINIIPVHPHELQGWHNATVALKAMYPTMKDVPKERLHGLFEIIVGASKSLCEYHGKANDYYNYQFCEIQYNGNIYDHIDSVLGFELK